MVVAVKKTLFHCSLFHCHGCQHGYQKVSHPLFRGFLRFLSNLLQSLITTSPPRTGSNLIPSLSSPMVHPTPLELQAGKHYLCTCGFSSNGAFCDGSHQGSGKAPHLLELDAAKTIFTCSCGTSETRPFCDGSHTRLSEADQ